MRWWLIPSLVLGTCTVFTVVLAVNHAPTAMYAPVLATLIGFGLGMGAERTAT